MNNCHNIFFSFHSLFFFSNIDHVAILKGIVSKFAARTYMCIKYENPLESVTGTTLGKHTVQAISITRKKNAFPSHYSFKLMKNTETHIFELQT